MNIKALLFSFYQEKVLAN